MAILEALQELGLRADEMELQQSGIVFLHGEQLANLWQEKKICFIFGRDGRKAHFLTDSGVDLSEALARVVANAAEINVTLDSQCEH